MSLRLSAEHSYEWKPQTQRVSHPQILAKTMSRRETAMDLEKMTEVRALIYYTKKRKQNKCHLIWRRAVSFNLDITAIWHQHRTGENGGFWAWIRSKFLRLVKARENKPFSVHHSDGHEFFSLADDPKAMLLKWRAESLGKRRVFNVWPKWKWLLSTESVDKIELQQHVFLTQSRTMDSSILPRKGSTVSTRTYQETVGVAVLGVGSSVNTIVHSLRNFSIGYVRQGKGTTVAQTVKFRSWIPNNFHILSKRLITDHCTLARKVPVISGK